MLLVMLFASLQILGVRSEARVETEISDRSQLRCSAVFETEGRLGRISLLRAEKWALQIVDGPANDAATTRPTVVIVDGERAPLIRDDSIETSAATFPSTSDFVGRLAREGTISVRYEFAPPAKPMILEITLSQAERAAWSACMMTLAQVDRYSH
jgi:hypothetical protein